MKRDRHSIAETQRMRATFNTVVEAKGDEPEILASTGAVDRERDILEPRGVVLDNFVKNGPILFQHDHSALPVGAATSVSVEADGIRVRWRWLENDERAARVRNAFEQGVLRAASVGFLPLEWQNREDDEYGVRFTKWELLEVSLVSVPANPQCVRVLKELGLLSGGEVPIKRPTSAAAPRFDAALLERTIAMLRSVKAGGQEPEVHRRMIQDVHDAALALGATCVPLTTDDDKYLTIDGAPIVDQADVLAGLTEKDIQEAMNEAIERVIQEHLMLVTGRVD